MAGRWGELVISRKKKRNVGAYVCWCCLWLKSDRYLSIVVDGWFQALYISEDRAGKLSSSSAKFTSSSLPASDTSTLHSKDDKSSRRNFKLYNKSFKIVNWPLLLTTDRARIIFTDRTGFRGSEGRAQGLPPTEALHQTVSFLPERNYVTFGYMLSRIRLSVLCLSFVTFVHPMHRARFLRHIVL